MRLFKTSKGIILLDEEKAWLIRTDWDQLVNREGLYGHLHYLTGQRKPIADIRAASYIGEYLMPPIGNQEVWAAGVTYTRSRDARMEESKQSGGADFYQKVYEAERPEIFFKALPHRVVGHGQDVAIRSDSTWNVPEPELTIFISQAGTIEGYTIGNDMSSRSIEGENPLYLPQAKSYDRSAALGPCLYVPQLPLPPSTSIHIEVKRKGKNVFKGSIKLQRMKRRLPELVDWLFKACHFPTGCYLMTGTGIVPGDHFTLAKGDAIRITIDGIGELINSVSIR